jgi:MSHA biogenesis protein MshI
MLARLKLKRKKPGWLAIAGDDQRVRYVHCVRRRGLRPEVQLASHADAHGGATALERASRDRALRAYECTTLLEPAQYQVFLMEGLNVPQQELKGALRWRVKDMLDYSPELATLDALPISMRGRDAPGRDLTYAVAARTEAVKACMLRFRDAGFPLRVIDILETAQRNIAALCESGSRALALLYLARDWGLLTINLGGELMTARRLDEGFDALARDASAQGLALELQRSFDHFERQFSGVPIEKVLVAPLPAPAPAVAARLGEALGLPVAELDLASVTELDPALASAERQWEYFHLVGAALREERAQ